MSTSAATQPAGGAALDQVAIATGGAAVAMAVLLWLVFQHHAGRSTVLQRAGDLAARFAHIPAWAALPSLVAAVALPVALLGMMWDISLHIDNGRDEGPLANPAHYLILFGLYGVFAAGVLAMALPRERPCASAVRVGPWQAPVGGVLIAAAGAFALIGFPLDDVWHRLFGQDVTLWGPTHLMLIGGAGMTLIGQSILLSEGMRVRRAAKAGRPTPDTPPAGRVPIFVALRRAGLMGGLLIGLSTFQGEFDFGVPQFRLVFHPMLIALAAGLALVAARLWIGRGGALLAVAFFFVVRGAIALIVGPVLGQTMPAQPLFLVEGLVVELAALSLAARPMLLGLVGGAGAGLAALVGEWPWTQVAFRIPWTADLLPESIVHVLVAGAAGGLLGAMLATGLRGEGLPRRAPAVFAVCLVALGALLADGLRTDTTSDLRASVTTDGGRVEVRFEDPRAAADPAFLNITAWQGRGLVVDRLERVSEGVYGSTREIPLDGSWKTLVRLQDGRTLVGLPLWAPADAAIPAPEIRVAEGRPQPFVGELEFLQRERKDAAAWLWTTANVVIGLIFLTFFCLLAWGTARVARSAREHDERPAPPAAPAAAPPREPVPA